MHTTKTYSPLGMQKWSGLLVRLTGHEPYLNLQLTNLSWTCLSFSGRPSLVAPDTIVVLCHVQKCLFWSSYLLLLPDFEIGEKAADNARALYERLLQRTKHVKVPNQACNLVTQLSCAI